MEQHLILFPDFRLGPRGGGSLLPGIGPSQRTWRTSLQSRRKIALRDCDELLPELCQDWVGYLSWKLSRNVQTYSWVSGTCPSSPSRTSSWGRHTRTLSTRSRPPGRRTTRRTRSSFSLVREQVQISGHTVFAWNFVFITNAMITFSTRHEFKWVEPLDL